MANLKDAPVAYSSCFAKTSSARPCCSDAVADASGASVKPWVHGSESGFVTVIVKVRVMACDTWLQVPVLTSIFVVNGLFYTNAA